MTRLPIRLRLTLAFAVAMAAVLAAIGFFLYLRVDSTVVGSVDRSLRAQADESLPHLATERELVDEDARAGSTVGEVLDGRGRVVRSTPAGLGPLLDGPVLKRVLAGQRMLRTSRLPGLEHRWRVLAVSVRAGGQPLAFVIARSLESRDEALGHLFDEFLIAGPLALLLASLAGYGLAAASLRPVESMRRRAQIVSATTPGQRLPVARSGDEISRLAETLNDMLDRLEAAFAHERRFVADASHELRTPLALLRAELEVALRRPRSRDELTGVLRSAAEDTERLSRLAEDLLLLATADQAGLPIRREPFAVANLFERMARRFATRLDEHGRAIVTSDGDGLVVDADADRLEQALGNLIDNAIKHGAGTITLSARVRGERAEIHVEDEGAGFPAAFAARAFDRFSRPDDGRTGAGAGLGLAIVELIAHAHGATAGVAERDGQGADVWISIPLAAGKHHDRRRPRPGRKSTGLERS
jgi:two-component system, OmpR family, sensor kinase